MNDLSTRCEAAQREITQLSTKNQAADERADELETQHQTAQSKAARLLIMYEEAHAEKEGLQTQLDAAEAKIGELSTNQVNAETEKTKITKERDTARTQLKNLAGINEKAQSDIAALRTKNKTAEIRISELTTKNRTVLKEVDELTANHQAVQREKEELAAERNATQEKFDKLSTKYMKVQTGWTRTAEKCEAVESQLGKVTVDLNVAGGEIQTCKHQLKERREELEVLEKELEDARMNKGLLDDALTKAKDEIHRLKDEEQQHEFEIHELQDDLDGEIQQRREIERKLSHHITFLEELLKEIQVNSQAAVHDKEALQSRIVLLESGVAEGQDTTRTLGETRNALQTTTAELNELRRKQADFEILQQKTVSQQNEIYQKDLEAQSVQQTLSKLQETIANLQEKARSNEHLAREKSVLEKEFSDLQAQNLDQAELETTIQNLRKEAQALNNALATAKTRVTEADALQLKNQELVTSIGSMAADLQQARHECARLPSLNEAIANLDNSISTLQEQLKTAMTEAEEEAQGKDEELQRRNEQITSLEQEKADLQQELLVCEGELANAKLDKEAQPQPQRRVADRSGKRGPVVKGPICSGSTDNVEGVEVFRDEADPELERPTPRSTGNLTVVPETQFDHQASAHVGQNDLLADEGLLNDGSTSELSSVPEDLTHQDDRHNDTQPKRQDQDSQKHDDQMQTKHQVMDQAPSSSYSSHGEQMLLDQLSQNDSGFVPGLSTLPSTITSRQDSGDEDVVGELDRANAMPWNRADWNNAPSRRRLRSESHFRGRQSTPFPGQTADPLHHQDMTPATPRERYLPNSAAKRKLDHDDVSKATQDTPKKMKRNPANLEVKGRREPSGKSQTAGQTSPPVTSGFRKGGSVNGTNATAIAKSQRSSRAGRKSSRQDKYAARFAADT
ncbi:hypothetical protein EDD36DRAFT_447723 [Exophiala viscosa]|uniref:Uncharacterized protein n=1 Tax=Exophiala viscosa TaxID=2486360 RepID=A0AAN6DQ95_9EURO|nr:hypothetical protein EDD36DRAFT_447723 [Exophiala viscosa]